jgi:hypothetical protein
MRTDVHPCLRRLPLLSVAVCLPGVLLVFPRASAAQYLGPASYLSSADSPFSGVGFSYFFLEDFEDGALNTPGVIADAGSVVGPGLFADSVDADDGAIDGSGAGGRSLLNSTTTSLTFTFSSGALGALPTHVGIVWTDVGSATPTTGLDNVSFEAFDASSTSLGSIGPFLLGDGLAQSQTAEDRFFGVINAGGISAIRISMATSTDWEVDHLQYGRVSATAAPEPASLLLALAGLPLAEAVMRRRRRLRR